MVQLQNFTQGTFTATAGFMGVREPCNLAKLLQQGGTGIAACTARHRSTSLIAGILCAAWGPDLIQALLVLEGYVGRRGQQGLHLPTATAPCHHTSPAQSTPVTSRSYARLTCRALCQCFCWVMMATWQGMSVELVQCMCKDAGLTRMKG